MVNLEQLQAHAFQLGSETCKFISGLASEGERAAVVLGAARVDAAVEKSLKAVLHHNSGGNDDLFDFDRPLGSFSAKICLAYRLGVIDAGMEHALQMLRKMRNEFAHSTAKITLSDSPHRERLRELVDEAKKSSQWPEGEKRLKAIEAPHVREFCIAITVIILALEISAFLNSSFVPTEIARLSPIKKTASGK